uniref:Malonyl-CoA decarboxylase C-terminal domain-containing protein n=1 Tax=Cuerna arida TaxID=1464854 RepID=A0A1B6GPL9_9HEMI
MVVKFVTSVCYKMIRRQSCMCFRQRTILRPEFLWRNNQALAFFEKNKSLIPSQFNWFRTLGNQHYQGHLSSNRKLSIEEVNKPIISLVSEIFKLKDARATSLVVENKLRSLVFLYINLKKDEKEGFLKIMATDYSVNHGSVANLSKQLADTDPSTLLRTEDKLRELLTPQYSWLFTHLSRMDGGIRFLVDLRRDILALLSNIDTKSPLYVVVQQMNSVLKEQLSLFFSGEFLRLQRVTWSSPATLLQKISDYEAVHPVRSWTDIRQRVGPYRRCFIFTHHSLPDEPLVMLHVALTEEISDSLKNIICRTGDEGVVKSNGHEEQPLNIKAFIFYSISATQKGLQGIDLGNYIIKQAAKELHSEYSHVTKFSTLSPIPTFRQWLTEKMKNAERGDDVFPRDEWKEILNLINPEDNSDAWAKLRSMLLNNSWIHVENFVKALKAPLMASCSRYLYAEKRRGYALDSVANFHLRNGAVMWRLNWLADTSPRTLTHSCGLMVNYRYYLDAVDTNSLKYIQEKSITASEQIMKLSKVS